MEKIQGAANTMFEKNKESYNKLIEYYEKYEGVRNGFDKVKSLKEQLESFLAGEIELDDMADTFRKQLLEAQNEMESSWIPWKRSKHPLTNGFKKGEINKTIEKEETQRHNTTLIKIAHEFIFLNTKIFDSRKYDRLLDLQAQCLDTYKITKLETKLPADTLLEALSKAIIILENTIAGMVQDGIPLLQNYDSSVEEYQKWQEKTGQFLQSWPIISTKIRKAFIQKFEDQT